MLKPGLQLVLGQHLTITPQLQQAIRLLQLSAHELELEVRAALEGNVMLEAAGDSAWGDADPECTGEDAAETPERIEAGPDDAVLPQYMTAGGRTGAPADEGEREREAVEPAPLRAHLLWQLEMAPLTPRDLSIGVALVDAIDERGYLGESLEAIRRSLEPELSVETDEVAAMLHYLQGFDPAGVGARDLGECLELQLRQLEPATPGLDVARRLVDGYLEDLARHDWRDLAHRLGVGAADVERAATLVRSLNPHPGGALAAAPDEYIVPDVVVSHRRDGWRVELNPAVAPQLRINPYYVSLLRSDAGLRGNDMLRGNLKEARWLIRSLEMRHQTLLKVAGALVERQQAFLAHGEEYMQPLVLKDIAAGIGVHESTVSRVVANKFMQTPRGVVAFRYFFSSRLATDDGGQRSATAIRALIRKLIAAEDAARPLSDGAIAEDLNARGVQVARRTVAKYREALGIPARGLRRRGAGGVQSAGRHAAAGTAAWRATA